MAETRDTRSLIFDAAREEFAAHGIAGARMRRIAAAAGVSSERLYAYFGDKQSLYLEVQRQTALEIASVKIDPFDVPGFVGRLYDQINEHPELMRINRWGQLEGVTPKNFKAGDPRITSYNENVNALREAQNLGLIDARFSPTELYAILGGLAATWEHAPVELRQLDIESREGTEIYEARRAAVVAAAMRLIAPRTADSGSASFAAEQPAGR
jgi:AcrR family transcriptional regulator